MPMADYTPVEFPGPLDMLIHVCEERHEFKFTEWSQFQWPLLTYTLHSEPTHWQINVQETQICTFLKIFFWKELILIE